MSSTFSELQTQLRERWELLPTRDQGPRDVVIIPSLSLDGLTMTNIAGVNHYEERMLFALSLLRHPRAQLVYVTSVPLHPAIVDYHLSLLQGIPIAHAKARLTLLSAHDASPRPLTHKILERPRLIERIRRAIDPRVAHMTCFTSSPAERDLAVQLGIPLYGVDPELLRLGTKGGSREAFERAGVPHPPGISGIDSADDIPRAIVELLGEHPDAKRVVIKHAQGFSGEGNAVVNVEGVHGDAAAIDGRLEALEVNGSFPKWFQFAAEFERQGDGVVELFIEGAQKRSPSGQIRITPAGDLQCVSTHDQLIGGPDGQTYEGCRFPADESYRMAIQDDALAVSRVLRDAGVIGRAAVDFVAVRREDDPDVWDRYAIEINLRMSGTTHPLMLLRMLSGGGYDADTGLYFTGRGEPRCYVASDTIKKPRYRGLLVDDLLDIAAVHELHYLPWSDTGVVFHLMGALSQFGKVGITAIGRTAEEAARFFRRTQECLDNETAVPPRGT
ncbi:MAG: peptide ligase PGM1-related protein [Myxococcota bacterium]